LEKLAALSVQLPEATGLLRGGAVALALLFVLPRLSERIPAAWSYSLGDSRQARPSAWSRTTGGGRGHAAGRAAVSCAATVPLIDYLGMGAAGIGVLLVVFSESLGTANEFAVKHGYEGRGRSGTDRARISANIGSALFGGMIAGGSMSASAVKEGRAPARRWSNLVTWVATS